MLNDFIAQIRDWSAKSFGLSSLSIAALDGQRNPASLVLVSQEDIYRVAPSLSRPVLLLRKGQEVSAKDLPRLIQGGVQPQQFRFKETCALSPESLIELPPKASANATIPKRNAELTKKGPVGREVAQSGQIFRRDSERRQETVLLLEENPKDIKRLIDCLFVCGFDLNRIYPLRRPAHLAWALERHKPDILIASNELMSNALTLNPNLNRQNLPKHLILTVDAPSPDDLPFSMGSGHSIPWSGLAESSSDMIDLQGGLSAQILRKPISRFTMKNLLGQVSMEAKVEANGLATPNDLTLLPQPRLKIG